MHRREFIAGMMSSLAGMAAVADAARSAIGARNMSLSVGSGADAEAMLQNWLSFFSDSQGDTFEDYSIVELGTNIFQNTNWNTKIHLVLHNLETVSKPGCFSGSRLVSITCPKLKSIIGQQQFMSSQLLTYVDFPELEYATTCQGLFAYCSNSLKEVNLGKVTGLANPYQTFFNCQKLENVYMQNMDSETLLGYPYVTGRTDFAPHQVVFHCADGNVVWSDDANNWVKETT